jgi:hypothetical protein
MVQSARMLDCSVSSQSSIGMKKLTVPEPVRYRTKLMQSGGVGGVSFHDADVQLW